MKLKRRILRLIGAGGLVALLLASIARTAEPMVAHVSDPAGLVQTQRLAAVDLDAKLLDFERRTGIRMLVEFHAKSPAAAEDQVPGAYMKALSAERGTLQHGVLVVYFADDPDWRIWVSNDLAARFAGKAGTVQELTASQAIHNVKEALFAAAKAKADADFGALKPTPDAPPGPAQHLAFWADALVEKLMARLQLR